MAKPKGEGPAMRNSLQVRVVATIVFTALLVSLVALALFSFFLHQDASFDGQGLGSFIASKGPWIALLSMFSAVILSLGAAWFIRRDLTDPLRRLAVFSREVSSGNLQAGLDGRYVCELAVLKDDMQAMLGRMRSTIGYSQGILDCLSEAFPYLTLDEGGKILGISERLLRLLDLSGRPEEFKGMTPGKAFFGDDSRETTSTEVLRTRMKVERKADIVTRLGNRRVFVSTASPIFDLDRRLVGSFTLYFDLTELNAREEEISRKNQDITRIAQQSKAIADEVSGAAGRLAELMVRAGRDTQQHQDRSAEVVTAMEQMSASILEVARNAQVAAKRAEQTSENAGDGAKSIMELVQTIGTVGATVQRLEKRIAELAGQAADIDKVVSMISDIADQTNLLALNAAIEAARAGDAGRGFAVVADEVRKLAEKTMAATKEVGTVILGIQSSSRDAGREMHQAAGAVKAITDKAGHSGKMLENILDLVKETSDQVHSIATAVEQQSVTTEQINRSVADMNGAAGNISEVVQSAGDSVGSLNAQAEQLSKSMNSFQTKGS
jgi:methyl-accepting chemotaxis protein